MTNTQKIIKYFAIAFAVLLIVSIISMAIKGLSFVINVFGDNNSVSDADLKDYKIKDVNKLYVDVEVADVEVVLGDKLSLRSNHEYLKVKESDGTLCVTETDRSWEMYSEKYKILITIPQDVTLDTATINTGAGKVLLDNFKTKKLTLELGAGNAKLNKVQVTEKTVFEGGAGEISVSECSFTNLDMQIGVGECNLTAFVLGNSQVECGVGEANLTFYKTADNDYTISVNKGLGPVTVDGKSVSDEEKIGNGKNKIDVECGVGDVDIKFADK